MSEQEKKIIQAIGEAIPLMSEARRNELAAFLEGVAFATQYIAGKEQAS